MRTAARWLAPWLDRLSRGRATPNMVTVAGVAIHGPAAWCVALGLFLPAAAILLVAVVLDFLDGELARLQGRSSTYGMLLDATTDRIADTIWYCGAGYWLAQHYGVFGAVCAIATCGTAQCVSYVKAKGEMAVAVHEAAALHKTDREDLHTRFQLGPASLSDRKEVMIVGLVSGCLLAAVVIVFVLSLVTIRNRWNAIIRSLEEL
jgi:phosphatidylglycerophosphate synthase